MEFHYMLWMTLFLFVLGRCSQVDGLGCNWGTRSTHPLPPNIVVNLMKENGFDKVKLFEANPEALQALGRSGIQVMVGIPNEMLAILASSVRAAEDWVSQNVSYYLSQKGVDIRYVAVGNEPFLKTYQNKFTQTTLPALENIQAALIKAGLGRDIKATVPLNADVYETGTGLPSGGDFRSDIHPLMVSLVKFLSQNGSPLTINIYPFLSLNADPHFPIDYAFFDGSASPVIDGPIAYTNVFEANYDTLVSSLERNGFSSIPVIVGEVGWPTDGAQNANPQMARRFYQGLINRINQGQGTPKRSAPPDIYFFSLTDEDAKSLEPGNFERHWGIFYFDGTVKYPLDLGKGKNLTAAKGVRYLARQWCVMAPNADILDPSLPQKLDLACTSADCTKLGLGSSCGGLDVRSNASHAFNIFYQTFNQQKGACERFGDLAVVTKIDPGYSDGSASACRYEIMIDTTRHEPLGNPGTSSGPAMDRGPLLVSSLLLMLWLLFSSR